ncbi:MAG: 3-deoxy-7-phosphoheptulonate synthase [Clostridiales bacterium]|nr:3-deoxy-7-phosphoheptulonate synthase [Clostridiales bacterium]
MIVVLRKGTSQQSTEKIIQNILSQGVEVTPVPGEKVMVLALVGDTTKVDVSRIEANRDVERIMRVGQPFQKASRFLHPHGSRITVGNFEIGGEHLAIIAGPCSVESAEQIIDIAKRVKAAGATMLRGGAFKPRTSPYDFQGLKYDGLEYLLEAKAETGLPIVSEIMSVYDIEVFEKEVDFIQVGTRNMQNFDLLRELGKVKKPILLKRGLAATVEEWLMSAEYIMAEGNEQVVLCERGIRTFETYTRNTTDLSAVLAVKKLSHLPIIVDPSHATGKWWMVDPMAKAAVAVGADGIMVEVHNDPMNALSDGEQSIKPELFAKLMHSIKPIALAVGRKTEE